MRIGLDYPELLHGDLIGSTRLPPAPPRAGRIRRSVISVAPADWPALLR